MRKAPFERWRARDENARFFCFRTMLTAVVETAQVTAVRVTATSFIFWDILSSIRWLPIPHLYATKASNERALVASSVSRSSNSLAAQRWLRTRERKGAKINRRVGGTANETLGSDAARERGSPNIRSMSDE